MSTIFTPERALRDIRKTPVILSAVLRPVTPDQAREARDGADGWTVSEVVGHLKDYEEIFLSRVRQTLQEDEPRLVPHNQDELVRLRGYAGADVHFLFKAFLELRREHVDVLASLSEAQWERRADHPRWGLITVLDHAINVALHDANHTEQIVRALGLADSLV